MKFDRMNSAGYFANLLSRQLSAELHKRLAPLGLAPGQFGPLVVLWERDGITQKEILKKFSVEQATLANTLTRMERDGLIVRKDHPADSRARTIHLTDKAHQIKDAAFAAAKETNDLAMTCLSDQEQKQFLDLLQRVTDTLDQG